MFSQTLEYALRVVAFLATRDAPATTRQIAAATKVPESYLAKLLQGLSRGGLVSSQRGLHGGSVLARPPAEITLYDVALAMDPKADPIPRIKTCPLGLKSHGTQLCPVHKRLDEAAEMVEKVFRDSTIADLLAEPSASKPLCESEPGTAAEPAAKGPRTAVVPLTVSPKR